VSLVGTNPDPEDGQTQYDELLPEAVDHMVAAFMHKAGLGQHPGQYQGPEVKNSNVSEEQ
jgi:hypothetical protein